ncbi:hypothetical protein [Polyangium spumosum]|uniref:hypothetical protein n=1 Tax=Polyangium spumosum TaxID=889282 RepID=UPI00129A33E0|nr:hypothetical protein [Polyangium spumosum]
MEPRVSDRLRFVWTVFPGVELVAYHAPELTAVFYMLGSSALPIRTWNAADLLARRDATGLALTVGQA